MTIPYLYEATEKINEKPGKLVSVEDLDIGITIKRFFYIYGFEETDKNIRGGHGHRNTTQCMVCLNGYCQVSFEKNGFVLNDRKKILIIPPNNTLTINCSKDCVILVLCDNHFKDDIYFEK
jgi:hypothetical protein